MVLYSIEIRPADIKDAGSICTICSEELGYPCETELVRTKLARLDADRESVFVAEIDGQPAGYVHVERYDLLYSETMANILGLAVKAAFQRSCIGTSLIAAAEKWAVENGIKTMRLNSGAERTGAHGFYRHLGYYSEKEQLRFTKNL